MTKVLPEGLCKQMSQEFYRRTRGDREKVSVVLRELLQQAFSHGMVSASPPKAEVDVVTRDGVDGLPGVWK